MVAIGSTNPEFGTSNQVDQKAGKSRVGLRITVVAITASALAACATKPLPPPPPPPPAPVVQSVPYRPLPPQGASYAMSIPPMGAGGQRMTVHREISDDETVWHFRSGWNVAALNCTSAQYAPVLDAYSAYIKDHSRALKQVNDRIDRVYRSQHGSRRAAIMAREDKMTSVYNYFALPPARSGFCRAALDVSNRYSAAPDQDPVAFAMTNFPVLETPFNTFYADYENYQRLSADWDAKYGAQYGASQPGWVAVQRNRRENGGSSTVQPTGFVADPATSGAAQVPIVPAPENTISQPVVEPIPDANPAGATQEPG